MRILVCVVNDQKKETSSTDGMQQSVKTSKLLEKRASQVNTLLKCSLFLIIDGENRSSPFECLKWKKPFWKETIPLLPT
jgi:hypothetical protein